MFRSNIIYPNAHNKLGECEVAEDFPIIVISLIDSLKRRFSIQRALDELGLTFQFYDAVDGRMQLPLEYEKQIDRVLTKQYRGAPMSNAEYACALSHTGVYNYILDNNLSGAIVLEDDAIPQQQLRQFISGDHYRDFNMVFLAHGESFVYRWTRQKLFQNVAVYNAAMNPWLAAAYTINANVAEQLLTKMIPIRFPADNWPCDLTKLGAVVSHPSIVLVDPKLSSDIGSRSSPPARQCKTRSKYFYAAYYKLKFQKRFLWKRIPCSYLAGD